ncbi:MAG TPA: hypothetical protein VGK99_13450 [Acidobacteriota bacterium]|jgi:hypothetical protein
MNGCDEFRNQIIEAALGEIGSAEQGALESHLKDCAVCRREQDRVVEVVRELRAATDFPVPRHFFVHPDDSPYTVRDIFRALTPAWKLGLAAATVVVALLVVFTAASFHARIEKGVYVFSFGTPIDPVPGRSEPSVDVGRLKPDLLRTLEEKSRRERLQWIQAMREEMDRSASTLSRRQRAELERTLASLERRVDERVFTAGLALQARSDKALSDMYNSMQAQRQRDVLLTQESLERWKAKDEIKASQTDAILQTLLQVAEVRLK